MNRPYFSALPSDIQISLYEACDFCPPKNSFSDFTDFRLERYFYLRCDQPKSFIY